MCLLQLMDKSFLDCPSHTPLVCETPPQQSLNICSHIQAQAGEWEQTGVHIRHCVSPSRDVWDCLGSALPDREPSPPQQVLSTPIPISSFTHKTPHTRFPLTLHLRQCSTPDSLRSKANTAATHQTGSGPLSPYEG